MRTNRKRLFQAASRLARPGAVLTLAVALLGAGCNSSSEPQVEVDCAPPPGLSTLVHRADAAVIGTVREVTTLKLGPGARDPIVSEYRTAVLKVEDVLWSTESLPAEVGKLLTVHLTGNGRHEGQEWCHGGVRVNDSDGPVVQGRQVLLLLDRYELFRGMEDVSGDGLGNFVAGQHLGNWTIEADRAVAVTPGRSARLEPLIARLKEARNAPLDRSSRRGAIDPLEATEPPPVSDGSLAPGDGQQRIAEPPAEGQSGP